ncbi:hypothetical protein, partial [Streptomyces sp. NRRL WC-3725]|uniref:hypothetical protein n=1 Tax=Streptomyces sp. NRRL WC-3725 TaxID=1463933 RepID=UPI001F1FE69F
HSARAQPAPGAGGGGRRATQQVIERAALRWVEYGYADTCNSAGGEGIGSAVALLGNGRARLVAWGRL